MRFHSALGTSAASFSMYVVSLVAAMAVNSAMQDTLGRHETAWGRWVWAVGATVVAILFITLIVMFSDGGNDTIQRLKQKADGNPSSTHPPMGRM